MIGRSGFGEASFLCGRLDFRRLVLVSFGSGVCSAEVGGATLETGSFETTDFSD